MTLRFLVDIPAISFISFGGGNHAEYNNKKITLRFNESKGSEIRASLREAGSQHGFQGGGVPCLVSYYILATFLPLFQGEEAIPDSLQLKTLHRYSYPFYWYFLTF